MMLNAVLKQFSIKIKKILLILIGTITWSITMVKSGWFYSSLGANGPGLGFWGANGHDGIWHIALSESLSRGSLQMPVFAGAKLQNYHIGFDLLLALLHKVTFIPTLNLYFQILPPIFAISIGLLVYWFIWNWTNSAKAAWWATFFVYFGGSFGWVMGRGESAFWSQQGISTLINPPFALSLIFIFLGLLTLKKLEQKFNLFNFIFSIFIFGSLIEIKAYAGVLALGGLFVSSLYLYFFKKKTIYLKVFMASLILAVILYLPLNNSSVSLFVFQPFWFLESMMGLTDRLNFTKYYSAMLAYRSGHNYLKAVPAYFVAFIIFWIGNMGTRLVGNLIIFRWIKRMKEISWVEVFMASVILAGAIIPLLFVQKGTPWNTIQFFYYSLFFSSILAGVFIGDFFKNSKLSTSLLCCIKVMLILLSTIPTTIITLRDVYIPSRPPAMIGTNEVAALKFLEGQPDGTVLTKPFNDFESKQAEANPPRPLYLYTSTAYVSALSKHQTFIEDEINLDITGYNWQARRKEVDGWYKEKDFSMARNFLVNNKIKYIYWIKVGQSPLDLKNLGLENIYENNLVTLYKVD